MAHQRLIPERLARVDARGRPRLALLITTTVAVILTYVQVTCKSNLFKDKTKIRSTLTIMRSWWCKCSELVAFHYQRILLYQLDHHFIHQLAFSLRLEVSERRFIQRNLRMEVELVAARTILANANLCLSSRVLHLLWRGAAREFANKYSTFSGYSA